MSLDRFINSVRTEVAKRFDLKTDAEIDAFFIGLEESAKDNQKALEKRDKMLRDAITELCKAKRLLKAAVEALNDGSCIKDCRQCENYKSCDYDNRFKWQHTNEAMKLIGEDGDAGMTDSELQRLERCKKCSKSTEAEDFQGGTELYCPLHGYPCDMIIQCVYEGDTGCQDTE